MTVLGKLGRRHLGMRKPWTSHSDSRWRRKMIPQANRWMICLTVLFRVEKFQQILRSHPPCQGKRSSLRWHPAGHPSPQGPHPLLSSLRLPRLHQAPSNLQPSQRAWSGALGKEGKLQLWERLPAHTRCLTLFSFLCCSFPLKSWGAWGNRLLCF